jgi:hypothetical protein
LFSKRNEIIYYSPNFHRHVVYEDKGNASKVVESFLWLDEAKARYPEAKAAQLVASNPSAMPMIAGGGLEEDAFNQTTNSRRYSLSFTSCDPNVLKKYETVVKKLDSDLGSSLFENFPEPDHRWVRERIIFLVSPFPDSGFPCDWPRAFFEGYGAGFSEAQAATAIRSLRHLLMIHPLDSSAKKRPLIFFYQRLRVKFEAVGQARMELDHWLAGACPTDAATFAFLNSIDISWDQCRVLLEAFYTSLVSCDLDPSWEFFASVPVQGVLSENSTHYLRMRLQLSPPEIYAMIKAHSRLSTYSASTLKSHLDAMESKIQLKSEELRRIVTRAPSVLGVSLAELDERITFLSYEGTTTLSDYKK